MSLLNPRNDIQCLRAFAVIAVILFHIWPKYFPNGYLGVDIFLVISGYIMSSCLSKITYNFSSIGLFYFSRIKRIFPLCLFVIFATVSVGKYLLLSGYFLGLTRESLWAIWFGTNLRTILHRESYFDMVEEYKFLLHTWSLGVEIQYYLIAPIIFGLTIYFKKPKIVISLTGLFSFIFYCYCVFNNYSAIAFNLFYSRIWQFMVGAFCCYCLPSADYSPIENEEIHSPKSYFTYNKFVQVSSAFLLFILLLIPIGIKTVFLKTCFTFAVSLLSFMFISSFQTSNTLPLILFAKPIFLYIGNASYSLYLTHWPIIVFAKYFNFFSISESMLLFPVLSVIGKNI